MFSVIPHLMRDPSDSDGSRLVGRDDRGCYTEVKDLKDALKKIMSLTKKGDVVLLSPGCASFGQFKNEFDRGEQFKKIIKNLR